MATSHYDILYQNSWTEYKNTPMLLTTQVHVEKMKHCLKHLLEIPLKIQQEDCRGFNRLRRQQLRQDDLDRNQSRPCSAKPTTGN